MTITLATILAKLPIAKLSETIEAHVRPLIRLLPDKRLGAVVVQIIISILGSQTPLVTGMARTNSKADGESWSIAKRIYRFLYNRRLKTVSLYQGLYAIGQQVIERENPAYLVVAVDPVNFEKPYAKAIEGVSVVHKATPPGLDGQARLAHGYPAITATVVNTRVPVTTYANWFSYVTPDFISQNREIEQSFESTCRLFPQHHIRFVGDSGLDDQKMFAKVGKLEQEFVFRASHLERIVEVYNERLDRWETEALQDLVDSVLYQATFQVVFTHAGKKHLDIVKLGWFKIRIPGKTQELWALVADDQTILRQVVLITNVPLETVQAVQSVYEDWRLRPRIEHGYRFDQEQGLDVEDMRLRTVDRMRRLFALVLLAAQIVFVVAEQWPPKAVLWLRQLGGKLGLSSDRDGPYWLLQGISAVIVTAMTVSFVALHPFPFQEFSCG
jgi:hypothetical protein